MRSINIVASRRRRKKMLKHAAGNFGSRHALIRTATETVERGWAFAYRHRRLFKRDMRSLWIQRINAAVRPLGMNYSRFIQAANKAGIALDRKALAELAYNDPAGFAAVVKAARAA